MSSSETILAISSSVGPAARMIVRMAGPDAMKMLRASIADERDDISPRRAANTRLRLRDNDFPAIAFHFPAPHSYTGDDLIELHIPGSPILAQELLQSFITRGARLAEAGEFTARAYLNGRMDLSKSEGVSAVISAQNDAELRAARQLLAGELARRLYPLMDELAQSLALLEAGIDFVEEDISFISRDDLLQRIDRVDDGLKQLLESSSRFERLPHQPRFVLVGKPNAGKSTLLNALAGHERAVVSPVAGTTRDALSAVIALRRGEITVVDVAGLEASEDDSARQQSAMDSIEQQMQESAAREIESADYVLQIVPVDHAVQPLPIRRSPDLLVRTKSDLARVSKTDLPSISVSAQTGEGLADLKGRLDQLAFERSSAESLLTLNARHVQAIDEGLRALARTRAEVQRSGSELIALGLREALDALGQILGQVSADDLLGRIFSSFCIGK